MEKCDSESLKNHLIEKFHPVERNEALYSIIDELLSNLPSELYQYFANRDGPSLLPKKLEEVFHIEKMTDRNVIRTWELVGLWFTKYEKRPFEAIQIFLALYYCMCKYQLQKNIRLEKGVPLVWISDCFKSIGYSGLSKKYLMLTLIEDAINGRGNVSADTTGVYFRLVWIMGMSNELLCNYVTIIYNIYIENNEYGNYPEWILNKLDNNWILEIPSFNEAFNYHCNSVYINFLLSKSGDKTGKALEHLAAYLMSCMPGVRTQINKKSKVSQYDVVCSMDGFQIDFRSEFGRYFICECKDWNTRKVDFSVFAKFCRVLDSVKSKFGILFSKNGITGKKRYEAAYLEQIKVHQDRGIIIIVIDENDIKSIMNGKNMIELLRERYENIRLDLE